MHKKTCKKTRAKIEQLVSISQQSTRAFCNSHFNITQYLTFVSIQIINYCTTTQKKTYKIDVKTSES